MQDTDDLRIRSLHPLLPPEILAEEIPIADRASQVVSEARRQAEAILEGEDDRLLVVAGPCSIHDPQAAQEYGGKLLGAAQDHRDDLLVAMRVYFEKPRTTVGWKGLINDPALDGSFQINRGLRMARKLLLDLAESGLPAGSEFLDTIIPQFTADLVSWGAIGARTTESQVHRELASGLSMPVGFKNGTNGSIQIAIDAVRASRQKHRFLSVTKQGLAAIVETTGNDRCHLNPPGLVPGAELRRRIDRRRMPAPGPGRTPSPADGRLQPRQQRQGPPEAARGGRGDRAAGGRRLARRLRSDDREPPGRRQPAAQPGPAHGPRAEHHRLLRLLGDHPGHPRGAVPGGPDAPPGRRLNGRRAGQGRGPD